MSTTCGTPPSSSSRSAIRPPTLRPRSRTLARRPARRNAPAHAAPEMPAPTTTTGRRCGLNSIRQPELAGGLRIAVGEERRAPLLLVALADGAGGAGERRQRAQEAAVRHVFPRDRALAPPARPAQGV